MADHTQTSKAMAAPAVTGRSRDRAWSDYIRRAGLGDEHALACLYDESSTLLYSIALRILGDCADAEEVTVDVFTYVWKNSANFDSGRGSATAWLVMLARSRAIDKLRAQTARRNSEAPIAQMDTLVFSTGVPDTAVPLFRVRELLQRALEQLPPEQKSLLEMAFFLGFTQSELAEKMNLPLGTVKTRIRMGVIRLRGLLKELEPL